MESITRRKFFAFLGGVAVAPLAAAEAIKKTVVAEVDFGWTWLIPEHTKEALSKNPSFSEIITKTLKNNTQKLADNVGQGNSLLMKLDNRDEYLKINYISIDEQNKRMEHKIAQRKLERDRLRRSNLIEYGKKFQTDTFREVDNAKMVWHNGYEKIGV